ncbi:MAG: helix-hairpin-helix domain-containing protein [Candidatus Bathyarchaeota archaeon]|nr:helix-hairpin-helix domain-containing protein [Candidatus Bathyarchaeota archaeon]
MRLARKPEPSAKKKKAKTVELTKVTGIGPKTAKNLTEAGIENANELASSNPEKVVKANGSSEERASSLIEDARSLVEQ